MITPKYFSTRQALHDYNHAAGERRCKSNRVDKRSRGWFMRRCGSDSSQCFTCHFHGDNMLGRVEGVIFRAIGNLALNGVTLYHVTVELTVNSGDWIFDSGRLKTLWDKFKNNVWRYYVNRDDKNHVWCLIASQGDMRGLPHYHVLSTQPPPENRVPSELDVHTVELGNTLTHRKKISRYMKKNLAAFAPFASHRFRTSQRTNSFYAWANPEIYHRHRYSERKLTADGAVYVYTALKIAETADCPPLNECRLCAVMLPHTANYFYRNGDYLRNECAICWGYRNAADKANQRAKNCGVPGVLTWQDVRAVVNVATKNHAYVDYWNGDYMLDWTLDHIEPLSRGGANTPENLCITSAATNARKGDRSLRQWLAVLAVDGKRHELHSAETVIQKPLFTLSKSA